MKITLFENAGQRNPSRSYIQLFGLSRSGKTSLLKHLIKNGKRGILSEEGKKPMKLMFFARYFLKNPLSTICLFHKLNTNKIMLNELGLAVYFKIFLLRNSYLVGVLSKYESTKKLKQPFFIDEFLLQSVFMILQRKSSEKEIMDVLRHLPEQNKILLIESDSEERYKRIKNTRFPGEQINRAYSIEWMKNSEFNYRIIKGILLRNYGPVQKNPKLV